MPRSVSVGPLVPVRRRAGVSSAEGALHAQPPDHAVAIVVGVLTFLLALLLLAAPSAK